MKLGDITRQNQADFLPKSYIGFFTRDMSLATGTQAITGVGFKPSSIIFFANVQTDPAISWGMDSVSNRAYIADNGNGTQQWQGGGGAAYPVSLQIATAVADYIDGKVNSMDTDGFTIGWTKNGTPTATARIQYMAFK